MVKIKSLRDAGTIISYSSVLKGLQITAREDVRIPILFSLPHGESGLRTASLITAGGVWHALSQSIGWLVRMTVSNDTDPVPDPSATVLLPRDKWPCTIYCS